MDSTLQHHSPPTTRDVAPATDLTVVRRRYHDDGFTVLGAVISPSAISAAVEHMDAVIDGRYETGVEPYPDGAQDRSRLVKIDQPHWADRTMLEVVSSPELGRRVATILDAEMVQVWCVQLLYKPPARDDVNVGWHTDLTYWSEWWEGEVFTAWLALSNVTEEAGPVRFVPGSHQWQLDAAGNFFDGDLDKLRAGIAVPEGARWREAAAVLAPGEASMHDKRTVHGSGPNRTDLPRRSLAIHMRTEKSRPLPTGHEIYVGHLDDPGRAPVIFGSH